MTQQYVAQACHVTHTYLSKIEADKALPSLVLLRELSVLFGLDYLDVCLLAGRYPEDVPRQDIERLWWQQRILLNELVAAVRPARNGEWCPACRAQITDVSSSGEHMESCALINALDGAA